MAGKGKAAASATPEKRAPRGTAKAKDPATWRPAFLAELANTCNVSEAARVAGIDRHAVYNHRDADPAFAAAWADAIEQGVEALELEARRRAMKGTTRPVFYMGVECGQVQEYSDTLMIFLLKAHRPKIYRDGATGQPDDPVNHRHSVEYVNDWRQAQRGDG